MPAIGLSWYKYTKKNVKNKNRQVFFLGKTKKKKIFIENKDLIT